MPRVVHTVRVDHTFVWSVFLERDQEVDLFAVTPLIPPPSEVPAMHGWGSSRVSPSEGSVMRILGIAASRADVLCKAEVAGSVSVASGPWILDPGKSLLVSPLRARTMESVRGTVCLLPNAPAGPVNVWWRVLFEMEQ